MADALTLAAMPNLIVGFETYLTLELDRRPRTVEAYVDVLQRFARFLTAHHGENGEALLELVDKAELSRFLHQPSAKGSPPSAPVFNRQLSALRTFFAWLVSDGVLAANPAL